MLSRTADRRTDAAPRRRKAQVEKARLRADLEAVALRIQTTAASIVGDNSKEAWQQAFDEIHKLRKVQIELTAQLRALSK